MRTAGHTTTRQSGHERCRATYALWNNKGGVGKSYLTFQIACEYARTHPDPNILVLDVCPQANASSMLLGGMSIGEQNLSALGSATPRRTIAGYIRDRIASPYHNPSRGADYLIRVADYNVHIPRSVYLIAGDDELEVLASRVSHATSPGPDDAWTKVHRWLADLIQDVRAQWGVPHITTFVDCNPSFGTYTELAMSSSDRLIIPFSADGSSRRAVTAVLALLYGIVRVGGQQSEFFLKSNEFRMSVPKIYCYVGNRLTQANYSSTSAFKSVGCRYRFALESSALRALQAPPFVPDQHPHPGLKPRAPLTKSAATADYRARCTRQMEQKGSPRRGLRTVEPGVLTPGVRALRHSRETLPLALTPTSVCGSGSRGSLPVLVPPGD